MGDALGSRLDRANIELAKELLSVKFSLDAYKIIGLNTSRIGQGQAFFGHVQRLSHLYAALGLAKIYEREKRHELCSVSGIYRLARDAEIKDPSAAATFARKYGVEPSGDWVKDTDQVFALGGHLKTGQSWTGQNRPVGAAPQARVLYRVGS